MTKKSKIYRKLQKHLNQQAIGYPRTLSNIDLDLLEYIFKEEEYVYIALNLSYKFQFIDEIYKSIQNNKETQKYRFSPSKVETIRILLEMRRIRSLGYRIRDEKEQYALMPYYEGLFELQTGNMTEHFSKLHKTITRDPMYQLSLLNIFPSQHRTIPIESAISPDHYVAPFNDVKKLVEDAEPPFLKIKCPCREVKKNQNHTCKVSEDFRVCLVMGDLGVLIKDLDMGIAITKDEAIEILRRNQKAGLVLQPSNYKKAESICSCCSCCCGLLSMIRNINRPADYWTSHYYSKNDTELCTACSICESRCPAKAITITEHAIVDRTRCIGCGVCIPSCPVEAMKLVHKDNPVAIPEAREDLHEEIYRNKKSFIGTLRTAFRMLRGKKWV